jgi:hypothetical protein
VLTEDRYASGDSSDEYLTEAMPSTMCALLRCTVTCSVVV